MRHRVRRSSVSIKLFGANDTLGLTVIKVITQDRGEQMVKDRKAQRVYAGDAFLGYQLLKSNAMPKLRESDASNAGFTANEMHAVVGLHGESYTAALSEKAREQRVSKGLREMDHVEAARMKFEHYQHAH